MKFQFTILSLLLVLILGGCSTAKLRNVWRDAEYKEKTTSILVVGVAIRKGRRQIFEGTLAKKLTAYGVKAIPSYTVLTKDEMSEQAAVEYVKQNNIDSVIVVKVLNSEAIKQRVAYTTAYTTNYPPTGRNPYYRGFNGWHADYTYWGTTVGTYDTNYVVSNMEANLYQRGNKKMVWSALVQIDGIDNDQSGVEDLAKALVKQMRKDGLI